MPWYALENRIQSYVIDQHPDMLIIGGISHAYNAAAVFSVIEQVRAILPKLDILVLSGTITEVGMGPKFFKTGIPAAIADQEQAKELEYRTDLAAGCAQRQVAYFDLRAAWEAHLQASGKPRSWFLRDYIHGNDRGRVLTGRLLSTWLTP